MVKMLFESYKSIMQMEQELKQLQARYVQKTKAFNEVATLLNETERIEFTRMLIAYLKEQNESEDK